ncbi:GPI ethanolamine phosphate transferase 2 isoform X3 [Ochotona curzoniae]|uniref:GPI ethanolamine phosphate transferase 2 isoform X3 n=1 Tax=Ochotona curzoniae TaxID=130825 RepID=UPI001B3457D5|nr:GPI ethanolamine phosphate transferase 2 isoform X3 [Ochotona curzoniae]
MRLGAGTFAACCVAIEVLGVAIFLRGFFPVPVRSSAGTGQQSELPAPEPSAGATSNWTKLPPPLFSKVVIVLIDALRDDFVFGPKGMKFMPYTTYLVEKGASHSFVAEAKPPTVTMPRIKALMTGSLPGFIDIVRNLDSPVLLEDSVIRQAKAAGKRIVFYGDETWVKLFPKHFAEYDGTTSFFVSDYTEVDNNVTRHLDQVLKRGDWDMLILHYLGLDHIGHVSGPNSPLIGHKLREMDGVLMKIHTSLLSQEKERALPSLLVLCGDHGMSDTGSHGASSMEEVSTPLIFISSAFERKPGGIRHPVRVQQTDLAATLAIGLGLPIPKDSVGSLLFPVVERRPMREQLRFLHLNTVQLSKLLQENVATYEKEPAFEQFKMSERLHGNWVRLYLEEGRSDVILGLGTKVVKQYLEALKTLSTALSTQGAQYDVYSMAMGTAMVLEHPARPRPRWSELELLLLLGTLGHMLSLGASSFVEEEHQTWYFLVNTLCLALSQQMHRSFLEDDQAVPTLPTADVACKVQARPVLPGDLRKWTVLASPWLVLVCCRMLRSLNQTGVQWAHRPDLGHWLTSSDHKAELSALAALSLLVIFLLTQRGCSPVSKGALALGLLGVYCYRVAVGNLLFPWRPDSRAISKGIIEARFVYVFVLGILFTGTKDLLRSQVLAAEHKIKTMGLWEIFSGLILLAALLFRPHNLPVLALSLLTQAVLANFVWKPLGHSAVEVTVMHYWFGQAFFYFQGNSNNIATVDISTGFVGFDSYAEAPAVLLTAFGTFAGPLLWASHLVHFLSSEASSGTALGHAGFCYALAGSASAAIYLVLVTALRYHLFIWSVFSPKLLYEGARLLLTAAVCAFCSAMDHTGTSGA